MIGITDLIPIDQKKTEKLDLYSSLSKFISKQYGKHVANEYESSLQTLQQQRNELRNLQDKSTAGRELCLKYASVLDYVDRHFPVNGGAERVSLTFSWHDVFTKKKVSQGNIFYEQANALFNGAALESQIATAENRLTDEGLKTSVKCFQNAAAIFTYIKEKICSKIVERITDDLTGESLECLSLYMLGCAQQCVVETADRGKMKPAILGKLASAASSIFSQCATLLNSNQELLDKTLQGHINFKALYFEAVANFYIAVDLHNNDEIGKELSRLQKAMDLMEESKKCKIHSSLKHQAKAFLEQVKKNYAIADNENQKIYHERIPDPSTLPAIEEKTLAKITAIESLNILVNLSDPFEKLYPIRVMEAKTKYNEQLNLRLQQYSRNAREHRDRIKQSLQQMGLPGSILAMEQKSGFPDTVHSKVEKVLKGGAIDNLYELKKALDDMSSTVHASCLKLQKLIEQEQADDEECRKQFGGRWQRYPSEKLTVNIKQQLNDFISKVNLARKSDTLINEKINSNISNFNRYFVQRSELDKLMPSPDLSDTGDSLGKVHSDLKQALSQMDQYLGREMELENEIKTARDEESVEQIFLQQQNNIDQAISKEISKFDDKFNEIKTLASKEDSLLQMISSANHVFNQQRTNNAISRRESVIQEATASLNKYDEILSNIKEGIQFYSSMQDILKKHQQKVEDFVFARKTEKQDMITNITSQVSGVSIQNPYHAQNRPYYAPQHQQQQPPPTYQQPSYQQQSSYQQPPRGVPPTYGAPPPHGHTHHPPHYNPHQQHHKK